MSKLKPTRYRVQLVQAQWYTGTVYARTDGEAEWLTRLLFEERPELLVAGYREIAEVIVTDDPETQENCK